MNKDEGIGHFFTKTAQVRDQLFAIDITVDDDDLVQTMVDGLPSSWETFMASVSGRENQPTFERLWHDCIEEEGRTSSMVTKEGNLALSAKRKKFKKPFPQQKKGKKPRGKFSDMSKVECYNCHKFGHFAKDCRQAKKKPKHKFQASATEAEEEEDEEPKRKKRRKPMLLTKMKNLEENTT